MTKYVPGSFLNVYETNEGEKIWAFLNTPENIVRMETATYLVRPAGEALAPALLKEFGDAVAHDDVKRMIGHMIRQIMEVQGYALDKTGVNITRDPCLFKRATRYKLSVEVEALDAL